MRESTGRSKQDFTSVWLPLAPPMRREGRGATDTIRAAEERSRMIEAVRGKARDGVGGVSGVTGVDYCTPNCARDVVESRRHGTL